MRFLCLHGTGTNNQVEAAIRYEMETHHVWEFVEGTVPTEIDAAIKPYYPATDEYFKYYDQYSPSELLAALEQLDLYVKADGPFDGVVGFSQGASLAATYLVQQSLLHPGAHAPFKFAVFFAAGKPIDPVLLADGNMEFLDLKKSEVRGTHSKVENEQPTRGLTTQMSPPYITIPTAHIWGRNDNLWPGSSQMMCDVCDEKTRTVSLNDEGHDIPGARAKDAVQSALHAIRRTIDFASMAQ